MQATWWFLDREAQNKRKQNARDADDQEGHAPAIHLADDAAGGIAEQDAEVEARGIDSKGRGAAFGLKHVRDHGVRWRATTGFTNPYAHAGSEKLSKVLCHA